MLPVSTPILQSAYEASVRDLAGAAQDVVAQYDMASINALRALIDRLKDVSAARVPHYAVILCVIASAVLTCCGSTLPPCMRCVGPGEGGGKDREEHHSGPAALQQPCGQRRIHPVVRAVTGYITYSASDCALPAGVV
jgi:hypothetical protein